MCLLSSGPSSQLGLSIVRPAKPRLPLAPHRPPDRPSCPRSPGLGRQEREKAWTFQG